MVVFFLIISSYVIALLRSILCGYFYVGGDSSALSTAGDQDIFSVPASILKGCPFTWLWGLGTMVSWEKSLYVIFVFLILMHK